MGVSVLMPIEADIVIMTDEPSKITSAIQIAKRTRRIVWQNIILRWVSKPCSCYLEPLALQRCGKLCSPM